MVSISDFSRSARASRHLFKRALRLFGRQPGIRQTAEWLSRHMPKGLYARSVLIIIVPIVILQGVVAFVFMERHWQTVTFRLSSMVTQNIAAIIEVYENYPQDDEHRILTTLAAEKLGLTIDFLPPDPLPPATEKPFFSLLDSTLSREVTRQIGRPFWIDTVGRSNIVEIRIRLEDAVLRVYARRSQTYASNSHIFIVWMLVTSLVLLFLATTFMRNQIKPIQQLADAADDFGKGREIPEDFKPSGAREVRRASAAFIEMRDRIERQIIQRTTMLAGVSHDLRTILTRFKLQLALIGKGPEIDELARDVYEMQDMLEEYMAFARGDMGEQASEISIEALLDELRADSERTGHATEVSFTGDPIVTLRPQAFKRCLTNLVDNACRYGSRIRIIATRTEHWLHIAVEDDGPGIPQEMREAVFRPFYRGDTARNQDVSGTGLGLAIAIDVARSHGGDIELGDSDLGGLKAKIRIPV
jgi:two-component system osmolarity sensor histidine kinase EnvZ